MRRRSERRRDERGAVAVEMALLLPILVMIIMGTVEFGLAYNAQLTLTSAARESVRSLAITKNQDTARTAAKSAAIGLNPALTDTNIAFSYDPVVSPVPTDCPAGYRATVTITYDLATLTGIAGPFTLKGRGVMLCGG